MQNIAIWENYMVIGYILGGIYLSFPIMFLIKSFNDSKDNIYNFIST